MAAWINSVLFALCGFLLHQISFISTTIFDHPSQQVSLFIFGDSFFDAGNNNYINTTTLEQANYWPYGETYFHFPTGRFSDGRLVSDFIAEHAKLPLIPPFLQPGSDQQYFGVNFASNAAGALVETFQGMVIDLKTQLNNYKKVVKRWRHELGYNKAQTTIAEAVYLFSIGSNDYTLPLLINSSTVPNSYSNSEFVGMVIGNLSQVIEEIYKIGGRKFSFINLPPLGCLPAMRILKPEDNGKCLKEASALISLHNTALTHLLSEMEFRLDGFKHTLFDFESNILIRMDHPSLFGFEEGKAACCGTGPLRGVYSCGGKRIGKKFELCEDPNGYVFWDSFHLTEKAYKQLADQMWASGVHHFFNGVGPSVLSKLSQI